MHEISARPGVYAVTTRFLRALDHDVITAADLGASRSADEELITISQQQGRIFVTRDRDFGGLVFVKELGSGVIYLRMAPSTVNTVHSELEGVLRSYSEASLQKAFVVIEPGRHRFRRLLQ
jgi:predicted nuclease of predicted toxin-antitoxin system